MDKSVFSDVKMLADCLASKNRNLSRSEAKKLIFERLLTWKDRSGPGPDSKNFLPLAHFSYFFRWKGFSEKADALDAAVEKLYKLFNGNYPVDELQHFLAALAKVDENEMRGVRKPNILQFSVLPSFTAVSPKGGKTQIILYNQLRVPIIDRLPALRSAAVDFPLLPSICCDQPEKDEGFSSSNGSSPIPAPFDEVVTSAAPQIREPVFKKPRPECVVSQLNAKDFDKFWNERLNSGPYRLISPRSLAETSSTVVSFAEFRRCFKALMSGIGSWIFVRSGTALVFESNVRIVGVSMVALRALMLPALELGNSLSGIHEYVKALEQVDSRRQSTLRSFRLGLVEMLRMYELETSSLCDDSTGLLNLIAKYGDYRSVFRQLTALCQTIWTHVQNKEFTAKWLLDTLYDLCTEFRFSSRTRPFLLTLFEHALRPHLDLINAWTTDINTALETAVDGFFIEVEQEAVFLSDRRFWTDAFTLRQEKIPNVFLPVAKQTLWMTKMTCLLHRLEVESPISVEVERCGFSLTKPALERNYDAVTEDTLDELMSAIRATWQRNVDSMKRSIRTTAPFGRKEFLSMCADLRSIFLFGDGDFSSTLVEKLFDQFSHGDQIDDPKDFFDPYLLNRALEQALKSKTLGKDVGRLDLSFLIQSSLDKDSIDYLSVFDQLKLCCRIPWPANIVLTESAVDWYQKPFGVLLKLELTLWTLTKLRKRLLKLGSAENGLLYHRTLMQLREIDLFTRNLRTYLLHQVVDVSWTAFTKKTMSLDDGEEFDSMYDMHNRYVSDFVNRCLLNPRAKKLLNVVEKLLKYAIDFGMVALSFFDEDEIGDQQVKDRLEEKMTKTEALHVNFTRMLKLFYSVLRKLAARGYQPHLTDLLLRMNFNYHYEDEKHMIETSA